MPVNRHDRFSRQDESCVDGAEVPQHSHKTVEELDAGELRLAHAITRDIDIPGDYDDSSNS